MIKTSGCWYTVLLPSGDYDIFRMSVSNKGEVTFNAIRMSDGRRVIGSISTTGILTILDETLNAEVLILERIR